MQSTTESESTFSTISLGSFGLQKVILDGDGKERIKLLDIHYVLGLVY